MKSAISFPAPLTVWIVLPLKITSRRSIGVADVDSAWILMRRVSPFFSCNTLPGSFSSMVRNNIGPFVAKLRPCFSARNQFAYVKLSPTFT